jgi:hypothetical protein
MVNGEPSTDLPCKLCSKLRSRHTKLHFDGRRTILVCDPEARPRRMYLAPDASTTKSAQTGSTLVVGLQPMSNDELAEISERAAVSAIDVQRLLATVAALQSGETHRDLWTQLEASRLREKLLLDGHQAQLAAARREARDAAIEDCARSVETYALPPAWIEAGAAKGIAEALRSAKGEGRHD